MANQNQPQAQENQLRNLSTLMEENLALQRQMIQSLTRIEESLIEIRIQSLTRIEESLIEIQGVVAARNSRREQEVGASINNGGGGVVASINGVGDMEAAAVPGQAESRLHDLSVMLQLVSTVRQYASYCVGVYNVMTHVSIKIFFAVALGSTVAILFLSFALAIIMQYFGMMRIWRR